MGSGPCVSGLRSQILRPALLNCYKLSQSVTEVLQSVTIISKCYRKILQSVARSYEKVRLVIQSVIIIAKSDGVLANSLITA